MNYLEDQWRKASLSANVTIGEVILNLEQVGLKIVLIVNQDGGLIGTISDGDIRRSMLKGLTLNSPIHDVINKSSLVAPIGLSREMVCQLMKINKVMHIPVVDGLNRVVGLHFLGGASLQPIERNNLMVIMAGGKGLRMRPLTQECPKPMLTIAGKPMLEHIIDRAKLEGFQHFVVSLQYLGHMIEEYFGNGKSKGVLIEYLRETTPLGTAGALSLLSPTPNVPFVVSNGDLISDIRYSEILNFHIQHEAMATMAVRTHELQNPFGVVQTNGEKIVGFEEKPIVRSNINAGVYVLEPQALSFLTKDTHCDMPNLFERLQTNAKRIVAYPIHEQWFDVGRINDYEALQNI